MHTQRTESEKLVRNWFYANARKEPVGPFTFAELERLHKTGRIPQDAFVIQKGGTEWLPFSQVLNPPLPSGEKSKHVKWTDQWVVVLLLFFVPPAGFFALWKSDRFVKSTKWILTVAACVLTLPTFLAILIEVGGVASSSHSSMTTPPTAAITAPPRSQVQQVVPTPAKATADQLSTAQKRVEALQAEMADFLDRLEKIHAGLQSGSYTQLEYSTVVRRHRIEVRDIKKRVQELAENPIYQDTPFAAQWSTIGHPLVNSVVNLDIASQQLVGLFAASQQIDEEQQKMFRKSAGDVRYEFGRLKKGLDELANPAAHQADANDRKAIRKRAMARMRQRISEFPGPRADTTAQPFTVVDTKRHERTDGRIIDNITIIAPTASCVEEYIQTTMKAAKEHAAVRRVDQVVCSLLPSADSDHLFRVALTRYEPAKSGEPAWDIQAAKAVYTAREIAIMEAWKAARAQTPSEQSEEIEAFIVKDGSISYEDIWSLPTPVPMKASPIF